MAVVGPPGTGDRVTLTVAGHLPSTHGRVAGIRHAAFDYCEFVLGGDTSCFDLLWCCAFVELLGAVFCERLGQQCFVLHLDFVLSQTLLQQSIESRLGLYSTWVPPPGD